MERNQSLDKCILMRCRWNICTTTTFIYISLLILVADSAESVIVNNFPHVLLQKVMLIGDQNHTAKERLKVLSHLIGIGTLDHKAPPNLFCYHYI